MLSSRSKNTSLLSALCLCVSLCGPGCGESRAESEREGDGGRGRERRRGGREGERRGDVKRWSARIAVLPCVDLFIVGFFCGKKNLSSCQSLQVPHDDDDGGDGGDGVPLVVERRHRSDEHGEVREQVPVQEQREKGGGGQRGRRLGATGAEHAHYRYKFKKTVRIIYSTSTVLYYLYL